jgi:DNA-binding response OmpR family regulator
MNAAAIQAGRPPVVLVIDDNPVIVELLCSFLETAHVESIPATSPEMALSLWKSNLDRISVVVTDLNMPGTNGDVLAARFLIDKPSLVVLFISGTPWVTKLSLQQGRNFFHKPFSFNQVTSRILEIIEPGRTRSKEAVGKTDPIWDLRLIKANSEESAALPDAKISKFSEKEDVDSQKSHYSIASFGDS